MQSVDQFNYCTFQQYNTWWNLQHEYEEEDEYYALIINAWTIHPHLFTMQYTHIPMHIDSTGRVLFTF